MNIIFVTIAYPRHSSESNLYTDLMDEFTSNGHQVYVACSSEKRYGKETHLTEEKGIQVLRVKTGNITSNPNYFLKGFALLRLQTQYINAINQYFSQISFDLIIYSTPPIQYNRIIKYLKSRSESATTYLLLKDIFPQNALDLGLFSKWNPIYWHFRNQERITYKLSDRIGCMSLANVSYLLKHNSFLSPSKVEVCANSLKDRGNIEKSKRSEIRQKIRKDFSIRENELLLIYGGNLGIAQGLEFLLQILKNQKENENVRFLIVGEGTWYPIIDEFLSEGKSKNVILQKRVSADSFKDMLIASDIGLIFLNPKFTIPNFPSRLTSNLEIGLPVIACTDSVSDIGDVVEKAGCGYKVISGDLNKFNAIIAKLKDETELLKIKSVNARILFEKEYTTLQSYKIILNSSLNKSNITKY